MQVGSQFGKKIKLETDFENLANLETFFEKNGSWSLNFRYWKGRREYEIGDKMGKWESEKEN